MGKTCYFISPRPEITINNLGSRSKGRCYVEGEYKITSTRRLSRASISKLWDAGLLGYGQGWSIKSPCDGNEPSAGYDLVEGVMIDDSGKKLDEPPTNWFGNPAEPSKMHYFEYITTYSCDSGD